MYISGRIKQNKSTIAHASFIVPVSACPKCTRSTILFDKYVKRCVLYRNFPYLVPVSTAPRSRREWLMVMVFFFYRGNKFRLELSFFSWIIVSMRNNGRLQYWIYWVTMHAMFFRSAAKSASLKWKRCNPWIIYSVLYDLININKNVGRGNFFISRIQFKIFTMILNFTVYNEIPNCFTKITLEHFWHNDLLTIYTRVCYIELFYILTVTESFLLTSCREITISFGYIVYKIVKIY